MGKAVEKLQPSPRGKIARSENESELGGAQPTKRSPPHPVDVHVGLEVRRLRKGMGLSQDKLAESIGLTFQQVQKYERGANRISASKLLEIGAFLGVPVAYFFNGLPGQVFADRLASSSRPAKTNPNEALALRIGQLGRHKRRLIAQLVEEMVGDEGRPPDPQDAPGKAGPQTNG